MSKPSYVVYPAKIANQLVRRYQKEIEDLKEQVEYQDLWRSEYLSRIDKAIEYIKSHTNNCMFELRIEEMEELLEILDEMNGVRKR